MINIKRRGKRAKKVTCRLKRRQHTLWIVNNNANEVVPDIVMDTAVDPKESSTTGDTFGNDEDLEEDAIPKESPPPYSEIDPMKKPKDRPDSLDIPTEQEQNNLEEGNSNDLEIPEGTYFIFKKNYTVWITGSVQM